MKHALMLAALVLILAKAGAAEIEVTGTLGCQHCNFSKVFEDVERKEDKEEFSHCAPAIMDARGVVYILKGTVTRDYHQGGQWVVKGKTADFKELTVIEMKKKP